MKENKNLIVFLRIAVITVLIFIVAFIVQNQDKSNIKMGEEVQGIITKDNILEFYKEASMKKIASQFIGKEMPDLNINSNGEKIDTENQRYMILFGQTTCSPCNETIEPFHKFTENHTNIETYSIYLDKKTENMGGYIKSHELGGKNVFGWDSLTIQSYTALGIEITPTIFFVDENNIVLFVNFGNLDNEALEYFYDLLYQ